MGFSLFSSNILPFFSKIPDNVSAFSNRNERFRVNFFVGHIKVVFGKKILIKLGQFLDKLYNALNNDKFTLKDLTKSLDTCDADILLEKLNYYGFLGITNT